MSTYAQMARQHYDAAVAEVRTIISTAEDERRDLTPQESKRAKTLDYDAARFKQQAEVAERADALAKEAAAFKGVTPRIERSASAVAYDVSDYSPNPAAFRDLLTQFAYNGYAAAEFRALQSEGGTAFGSTFHRELTTYERTASPMMDPGIVSMNNVRTGEQHVFPRLTSDIAYGGTVVAEAAGIGTFDPTISAKLAKPFKYAAINVFSTELDTDNVINLERALAFSTGRELALDVGAHLTVGTGTTQPEGFIVAATNGGTATGGTATQGFNFVAPFDLPKIFMSVAAPYRARGTWMVATSAYQKILEWRDTDGVPIALPLAESPSGLGIYGRPLVENPALAAVSSASKSIAFGDFSRYEVVRLPVRVELSREATVGGASLFQTDQVAIRVVERVDGCLVDSASVAYLVSAAT